MPSVLITGGSGMIGSRLTKLLLDRGYTVTHLERSRRDSKVKLFTWDVKANKIDQGAFDGVDAIIHLAGAGVADKRWSEDRKKEILESRTKSTHLLFEELAKGNHKVKTFICASGTGYYGTQCEGQPLSESAQPGSDFLAHVSQRWENEASSIATLGIRVVLLRTGIVLSTSGGALPKLMAPMKFFAGAPLGSGKQQMSWIHIDDHCGIFIKALEDSKINGPYNSVAPQTVTNEAFTKILARHLHKPLLLPNIPAFALRVILGEMAMTVLTGCSISPAKIKDAGYKFKFEALDQALADLIPK